MKKDHTYIKKDSFQLSSSQTRYRPSSAIHQRPGTAAAAAYKLPSLGNNTLDCAATTTTNAKGVGSQIEKEKLFEETMQLKIVISKLKKELAQVTKENKQKDIQLTLKDQEIEGIIEDYDNPELVQPLQDNSLIYKLKQQYHNLKKDYQDELRQADFLKQNIKITKMNELNIEYDILNQQYDKITALYQNSLQVKEDNQSKLLEYSQIKENLHHQNIIIDSLKENVDNSYVTEKKLQKTIDELQAQSQKDTTALNKIIEENNGIHKQIEALTAERKSTIIDYSSTKEKCLKKIEELEIQLKVYKNQSNNSGKTVSELQATKSVLEKNKPKDRRELINEQNNILINQRAPKKKQHEENVDVQLKQLQDKLETSKQKEKYLKEKFREYEEKVKELIQQHNIQIANNEAGFALNHDNPLYTSNDSNDLLQTKKMTSNQYNQFTYILFKNFEAKKVTKEIAMEKIINPTFDHNTQGDTLEIVVNKFAKNILDLLACANPTDKERLELYLSALVYNFNGHVSKVNDSFLTLFSYIEQYPQQREDKLRLHIIKKYKEKFEMLKECITRTNNSSGYISLLDIKRVIDENKIILKDKYIEFLFYKMKQFTDDNASLFDLKISLLDDLLVLYSSNGSDSIQEITEKEYEKYIKEALKIMRKGLEKNKVALRDILKDNIVKISKPKTCDVIVINELGDEMRKINVELTEMHLSCLCTKYCANAELKAVDIDQIQSDLNDLSSSSSSSSSKPHLPELNEIIKYDSNDDDINVFQGNKTD